MTCPRCGTEIKENIVRKLADIEDKNLRNNDSVAWDDFKDVSLGSVLETFSEEEGRELKKMPREAEADEEENPILAAYLAGHRGWAEERQPEATGEEKPVEANTPEIGEEVAEEVPEAGTPTDEVEVVSEPAKVADQTEMIPESTEEADQVEPVSEAAVTAEGAEKSTVSTDESEPAEESDVTEVPMTDREVQEEAAATQGAASGESQPAVKATAKPQVEPAAVVEASAKTPPEPVESLETTKQPTKGPIGKDVAQQPKKRPWKALAVVAAAAALVGGGGFVAHQYSQAKTEEQAKVTKAFADLTAQLSGFYSDDSRQYLNTDKDAAAVTVFLKELAAYQDEKGCQEVKDEAEVLLEQYEAVATVNQLFEKPVIVMDQVKKDVPIAATTIPTLTLSEEDAVSKQIKTALTLAQNQADALTAAGNAVAKVYANGKTVAEADQSAYEEAVKAVGKLLDGKQKAQLQKELATVDADLKKKAADAADKQAAEKAAAEAKAAEEQQANAAKAATLPAEASPNMQINSDNQPILGTVASDVADVNNPAWTWNAGMQEMVLNICKQRGYIVEGGYTLERVRIENGEGYYNLYATNNLAPFTKGLSAKDLPMYLVTINCKTGYFRGNGNDHTIR